MDKHDAGPGPNGLSSTHTVLYFAYGGNMNPTQIASRCREPKAVAVARLPGHALAFHGRSERWDGGLETAVLKPGHDLYGVVHELSPDAFDRLDAWQGVKLDGTGGYFHCPADVIAADGTVHSVLMYKKTTLGDVTLPSREYLSHIVVGAVAHGLPADYVAGLNALPSRQAGYPVPKQESTDKFLMAMVSPSCAC